MNIWTNAKILWPRMCLTYLWTQDLKTVWKLLNCKVFFSFKQTAHQEQVYPIWSLSFWNIWLLLGIFLLLMWYHGESVPWATRSSLGIQAHLYCEFIEMAELTTDDDLAITSIAQWVEKVLPHGSGAENPVPRKSALVLFPPGWAAAVLVQPLSAAAEIFFLFPFSQ